MYNVLDRVAGLRYEMVEYHDIFPKSLYAGRSEMVELAGMRNNGCIGLDADGKIEEVMGMKVHRVDADALLEIGLSIKELTSGECDDSTPHKLLGYN